MEIEVRFEIHCPIEVRGCKCAMMVAHQVSYFRTQQELDISFAPISIIIEREPIMDFTIPYWIEENTMAYKRLTESRIYLYLKPFHLYVSVRRCFCLGTSHKTVRLSAQPEVLMVVGCVIVPRCCFRSQFQ